MANERLRAAISASSATIQSVAAQVGVDPKTVERWITTGRTPHRSHRWKAATFLGVDELYLWPTVARQAETASASELVTYYPHRGVVPVDLWSSLIDNAVSHIEVLVYAACSSSTAIPNSRTGWPGRRGPEHKCASSSAIPPPR